MGRFCTTITIVTAIAAIAPAGGRSASAQSTQVPLAWNAPAGCPLTAAVLAELRRNLAESGEAEAPFIAEVTVREPVAGKWHATLRLEARGGRLERAFEAETCEAIASATALIIALSSEGGRGAAPSKAESPAVAVQVNDERGRGPTRADGWANYWEPSFLALHVNAVIDSGMMPNDPAVGIQAAIGPTWLAPGWRLRLLANTTFFPSQRVTDTISFPNRTADIWVLSLGGRACAAAVLGRFDLGLCGGGELVAMHAAMITIPPDADNDTQFWFAPVGSIDTSWQFHPSASVFARLDLAVPTTRRSFHQVNDVSDFYKVSAVAVRGAFGFEIRFD